MSNKKVQISFDNEKAAEHFALWLCNLGEQEYWEWMRCREEDEGGDITATSFNYHTDGKNFNHADIKAKCGRLDK